MANCPQHPGSKGVYVWPIGSQKSYCAKCKTQIIAARAQVPSYVQPKDCFIVYAGGAKGWTVIPGTGCAHYVAHTLNLRAVGQQEHCLSDFILRVPDLEGDYRLKKVASLASVEKNDIWIGRVPHAHTGIVTSIVDIPADPKDPKKTAKRQIGITHDSSGQNKLLESDFETYFHGKGHFYRVGSPALVSTTKASASSKPAATP